MSEPASSLTNSADRSGEALPPTVTVDSGQENETLKPVRDKDETGANDNIKHKNNTDSSNFDLHLSTSKDIMSEASVPPVTATRKLPIPNTPANSTAGLKGILIKPKRILPAQPDYSKVKRPPPETAGSNKTGDTREEVIHSGLNSYTIKGEIKSEETVRKVTIPKLEIDVDRLKLLFRVPVKGSVASVKAIPEKGNLNENGTTESVKDNDSQKPSRSQSDCGLVPQPLITRESTFYTCTPDGVSKVKEWCSSGDVSKMMDHEVNEPGEHGIRSSSPKSSTTWDRSSSGYSSDERPDPRSPPPIQNTCTSVDTVKTVADSPDDDNASQTIERLSADSANVCNDDTQLSETDESVTAAVGEEFNDIKTTENVDSCEPVLNECETEIATTQGKTENVCQTNCNNTVNNTKPVCASESPRQVPRRPVWALNPPLPNSGRIQYRKSGSEPTISLRYPSKSGAADGLEVFGKSCSKTPTPNRSESVTSDTDKNDCTGRMDLSTPTSAFVPTEKSVSPDTGAEMSRLDRPVKELPMRVTPIRTKFSPSLRGHVDMKSLSMGINGPKDERDIRKSLHDLNSPRRQTPAGKSLPIRARHTIHANANQLINTFETIPGQPITASQTSAQKTGFDQGRPKFFGKKMWRAPSGQPENAQMRPFSPFGGTLPPSKIKEQESQKFNHSDGD